MRSMISTRAQSGELQMPNIKSTDCNLPHALPINKAHNTASSASPPAVSITAANKIFSNGTQALTHINLDIQDGEFVSFIGPSGCGKSTLLKISANLHLPTEGLISWWGGDERQLGRSGRRLAFVFQDPTLMPWATVRKNVRLALDLEPTDKQDRRALVAAALEQVGLTRFADSYPRQLSGGMRMHVSIARGLVDSPDLLLMDEPFGALDEFTRNKLDLDLAQLAWTRRLTTLFVTHSIYEAVFLSTRIIVMATHPGRIFGELAIDEPQPRTDAFRDTEYFSSLCRQLSRMLASASNAVGPE
jgi:NitT/TauT family transport system ATP-binding protein